MTVSAARSNPISQRVMKPLEVDVYMAAKEPIRHVYESYDQVVVSYSGGKDSTCVLELTIQVARELGRLPVDVLFFDEEVLLPETEAMVRHTRERPEVNLVWVCGQVGTGTLPPMNTALDHLGPGEAGRLGQGAAALRPLDGRDEVSGTGGRHC